MEPDKVPFSAHKEKTAEDCEALAQIITDLAAQCREGNMAAFEQFWVSGGTEEGDAKINELRERLVLRYMCRADAVTG